MGGQERKTSNSDFVTDGPTDRKVAHSRVMLNLPLLQSLKFQFDNVPERIFKKGKHFQMSVFHAGSEFAIRNSILAT